MPPFLPSSLAPDLNQDEDAEENEEGVLDGEGEQGEAKETTVEEAIKGDLKGFLEKRRASGGSRPCGPHDLGPVYEVVFGIGREEMMGRGFWEGLGGRAVGRGEVGVWGRRKERGS